MSILYIPFVTFSLLLIINLILIFIPNNLKRRTMEQGIRNIQICNIVCYAIAIIITTLVLLLHYTYFKSSMIITPKTYVLIVLMTTFVLFGTFTYFPCILKLSNENSHDLKVINALFGTLVKVKYANESIKSLTDFLVDNKQLLLDYGSFDIYNAITMNIIPDSSVIPSELSMLALTHCENLINELENFKPEPFPILNIIFTFCGTTIIALLTTMISLK